MSPRFLSPQISAGWRLQTFLRQFITAAYPLSCGKLWLSSVVWSVRGSAMKKTHNFRRVGKNFGPILSLLWTKVYDISKLRRRPPSTCQCTCSIMYIMFRSEDIAVKVTAKLWNRRKNWFLGSRFLGKRIPLISDMHFQIALTSEHVAGFG